MKQTKRIPKAPGYLTPKTKSMWRAVTSKYDLEVDYLETLRIALENLDLADQARELLRKEGLVINGKKHPALDACKLHDGLYLRAVRQLGLDVIPPGAVGRPGGS